MEKFEKKSLLELKRMSLVELNKYMSDKREYEYNNNIPLNYDAIEIRKRIHFLVTTILKIDRIINAHEKITIMNDLRTRKEEGQIYACTHIGGNDVHRLVEAINDSSYIFFGDPGVAYTDPVGFLLYMNGTIYVHTREKLDRKIGYERAVELLNHGGKLIIFPEGAWNIDTNLPVAKTFKGATRMAYETGRDITPVAIEQYGNEFIVNIGENYGKAIIMKNENIGKIISVDIAKLPSRQTEVLIGCEPKVKSKHKILQKLFIKIFGYKLVFDKRETKILEIKAEDCPKVGVDSNLSIEL